MCVGTQAENQRRQRENEQRKRQSVPVVLWFELGRHRTQSFVQKRLPEPILFYNCFREDRSFDSVLTNLPNCKTALHPARPGDWGYKGYRHPEGVLWFQGSKYTREKLLEYRKNVPNVELDNLLGFEGWMTPNSFIEVHGIGKGNGWKKYFR